MAKKEKLAAKLEKEIEKPDFWDNKKEAAEKSKELADLKEEIGEWQKFEKELKELEDLAKLGGDEKLQKELEEKIENFKKQLAREEFKTFLSGKYDKNNAILEIRAGAGGVDSQDWTTMLLRMYERYCARRGFQTEIIHQSFGEGGGPEGRIGTKSATLEIKGNYAYGYLKKETGVHRLVRISPFSAQKLRHTSFTSVEVLPEFEKDEEDIKINPDDLKIDFFRSSGPGGQNVNKRETAVRITHLATNIIVACQSERFQAQNKEKAMKILYSKLFLLKEAEAKKEKEKVKGKITSASWGNQIRSYVLHPYKMVKDLRTEVETSSVEKVLDGELDQFIEAEIKI